MNFVHFSISTSRRTVADLEVLLFIQYLKSQRYSQFS